LLVGNDSALMDAIEAEASKRAERYALALIPNRFSLSREITSDSGVSSKDARVVVDWKPGSAVSARALVVAAKNRVGRIDEAILVCAPPHVRRAVTALKPVDVEVLMNDHVKSWFFLAQELAAEFKERKQGSLILVFPEASGGKDGAPDILGSVALGAFRALSIGLLAMASDEEYFAQGFTGDEAGNEAGFAGFIFKQLDDTRRRVNGKLHKFGKSGFFK